jgi:hypothetical protein
VEYYIRSPKSNEHLLSVSLNSTAISVGDIIRGVLLHTALLSDGTYTDAREEVRECSHERRGSRELVGRVVVRLECRETTDASLLARGAAFAPEPTPIPGHAALSAAVSEHRKHRVAIAAAVVEEWEYFLVNVEHLPFDVPVFASTCTQTFHSDVLTLEWYLRIQAFFVDMVCDDLRRASPAGSSVHRRSGPAQELIVPILLFGETPSQNPRMGPAFYGV